jgi:hypothetical protein
MLKTSSLVRSTRWRNTARGSSATAAIRERYSGFVVPDPYDPPSAVPPTEHDAVVTQGKWQRIAALVVNIHVIRQTPLKRPGSDSSQATQYPLHERRGDLGCYQPSFTAVLSHLSWLAPNRVSNIQSQLILGQLATGSQRVCAMGRNRA